jgi:hypothetical protein
LHNAHPFGGKLNETILISDRNGSDITPPWWMVRGMYCGTTFLHLLRAPGPPGREAERPA